MSEAPITCAGCGKDVHPLAVFPKQRCVDCHASDPQVQRELATMTGERLAQMWGAPRR